MSRPRRLVEKARALSRLVRHGLLGRRPSTPRSLILLVTNRCNMRCRHCEDGDVGYEGDPLTLDEIGRLVDELEPVAELALSGGEPFLRRDLDDICALFVERGKARSITIATNGFSPDGIGEATARILSRCAGATLNLVLSLDGFEGTHDGIRTPGSFARTLATARRLAELRSRSPGFGFCFNATIHEANHRELPDLARFVEGEFQANLECNVLTGRPSDPGVGLPPLDELARTLDGIAASRRALEADFLRVLRDARLAAVASDRQVVPCRAGSLIAVVRANGDVHSCNKLPPLGNLRERSFEEIWRSPAALAEARAIRAGACRCNSDCFLVTSLMYDWRLPFRMLGKRLGRRAPAAHGDSAGTGFPPGAAGTARDVSRSGGPAA